MIYLNKEAFRRYFFYGDQNPEKTLEGIMFFTYQNRKDTSKGKQEEVIKQFMQEIKPLYRQYYRFIELNNKPNIYNYKREEKEEELETRIYQKIEQLRNEDEIETGEIQERLNWRYRILENDNTNWPLLFNNAKEKFRDDWDDKKKESWINEKKQEWRAKTLNYEKSLRERGTKKLIIGENELKYSELQRSKYAHFPEGSMTREEHNYRQEYVEYNRKEWGKDTRKEMHVNSDTENKYIPNVLRHWTEDIYDILKVLTEIEENNPRAYTDLWLRTRQNRAKNGTINGIDEEEIARINHACEKIRKIRLEEEKQEEIEIE